MKRKFLLLGVLACLLSTLTVSHADEFDDMRIRWYNTMTGGSSLPDDPQVNALVSQVNDTAQTRWSTLNKAPGRTYLWSDLTSITQSEQVTENYNRLRSMALAHETDGAALQGNATLRADILSALDWMYVNRYFKPKPTPLPPGEHQSGYDNWWDWQIGAPFKLFDTAILLYPHLSATQIANWTAVFDHFTPYPNGDGSKMTSTGRAVALRGILGKNAAKMVSVRDAMSVAFNYVTPIADGFARDGSYVMHDRIPYNGAYGHAQLRDTSVITGLLAASNSWKVTDPDLANTFAWVYDSFEPLMYGGAMMDMVRGRTTTRYGGSDRQVGRLVINAVITTLDAAPPAITADFKRMIKAWMLEDTYEPYVANETDIGMLVKAKAILADPAVTPWVRSPGFRMFPGMDRAVAHRQNWALGLAMFSSRIYNYELIDNENIKGWHTGSGMTYLYTSDLGHYARDYWPTIDALFMPGTTVIPTHFPGDDALSGRNWVGGAALDMFGAVGMEMAQPGIGLTGKKSWFVFDQEVVCLGADIDNTTTSAVYTTVENRQLNSAGNNAFMVNGTAQLTGGPVTMPTPPAVSTPVTFSNVNWAHLAGPDATSGIGYYFPQPATVLGLREARTGNWKQINNRPVTPNTPITRNYLSLRLSHGSGPDDQSYAYTLLPTMTAAQVAVYAAAPGVTILENSAQAQAARKAALGLTAVNFWQDASKTVGAITAAAKSSVVMLEDEVGGTLDLAVADPTWTKTSLSFTINRPALNVNTALTDTGIAVTQLRPTVQFTANVASVRGVTKRLALNTAVVVDNKNANNTDGSTAAANGTWFESTGAGFWGTESVNDGNTGKSASKYFTFTPNIPAAGTYEVGFWYVAHVLRATNVPVEITGSAGTTTVIVNQQTNGSQWFNLGTYHFNAGTSGKVVVRTRHANGTNTNHYVVADAVRFRPVTLDASVVVTVDSNNANNTGGSTATPTAPSNSLWGTSTGVGNFGGNYYHDGNTGKSSGKYVTFTPNLPSGGTYEVFVWHVSHANRATNVPVEINRSGGTDTVIVNQQINSSQWVSLGTYTFNAGTGGSVVIRTQHADGTNTNNHVVADAARFVKL